MSDKELENFIFKFRQLRKAGYTAHLDIDAFAGRSWIGLRVMLDPVQLHQRKPGKQRSPSYFRRQEKRKLTQSSAASSHNKKDTEEVSEAVTVTDNVSEAVTDPVIDAEEASTVDHIQQADNDASLNNGKPKDAGKASDVAVNSESVITQANKDSDKSRSYKENHSVYRCEL